MALYKHYIETEEEYPMKEVRSDLIEFSNAIAFEDAEVDLRAKLNLCPHVGHGHWVGWCQ